MSENEKTNEGEVEGKAFDRKGKVDLTRYCFAQDGVLDYTKAWEAFQADLTQFWEEKQKGYPEIQEKVIAVFDAFPGASLNIPYIINRILPTMSYPPSEHSMWEGKVREVLHNMRDLGLLSIGRGKGQGVKRIDPNAEKKA